MRGQLFSIDFMIGLALFLVVIAMVFVLGVIKPNMSSLSIQGRVNQITDFLVLNKLGTENILGCNKILNMSSQPYEVIRNETGASPFNIYVEFKNNTNICSGNQTSIGMVVTNSTATTSVVRIVNVQGNKMQMVVKLYA